MKLFSYFDFNHAKNHSTGASIGEGGGINNTLIFSFFIALIDFFT